jgi:hypothetical protein
MLKYHLLLRVGGRNRPRMPRRRFSQLFRGGNLRIPDRVGAGIIRRDAPAIPGIAARTGKMNMRIGLISFLLAAFPLSGQQTPPLEEARWLAVREMAMEGQGWQDTKQPFDRLPARAEALVRAPVWDLSLDSAGLCARFVTDGTWIRARWRLRKERLALPNMPATGVSGLDLYVRDRGRWHWLANGAPEQYPENDRMLVRGLAGGSREYLLYLPLYNGVASVEVGVAPDARLERAPPRAGKPIVFYGTSILQGGCASRPGMAYPALISRKLDWPAVNLGFSGNGKSEPEMARLIAEIDAAAYVLDSLPNLETKEVSERVEPFIRTIRAAHPAAPIVLVGHVIYTNGDYVASRRQRAAAANAALRGIYEKLRQAGDRNLHYVPAKDLIGSDGEAAVDGTHPTDLGFLRMSEVIGKTLQAVLAKRSR